ncbi:hypothetical protein MBLNU459_g5905t1 [Dothideomycetes sp. NU459]
MTNDDVEIAPWKALFFFTIKAHMPCLILGLISAMFAGVASPAQALLIGKVFAGFTTATSGAALLTNETKHIFWMLGVATGNWFLHFLFFSSWVAFGELQANSVRDRLFNSLLEKDTEWYDLRKHGTGALVTRLQAQIRELQLATAQPLGTLFVLIAEACFNIGLAFFYSWKLTLVIISTTPIVICIIAFLGARMQRYVKNQEDKLTETLQYVTSALNAIDTVKCFNGQEHELQKYVKTLAEAASWYYRVVNINAQQFGLTTFMASAMFVQGFYYGGVLVDAGEKNTGDVVTTFIAAIGAFNAIAGILPQMIVLEKGRTAGATLRAVVAQMATGQAKPRGPELQKEEDICDADINFKSVSFAYPTRPDQMVLRNVSFSIGGGTTTFIVGKSGSGKSTVGQLLMRFYPTTSGSISLGGWPISSLDLTWLRSRVTLVEQSSVLFEDTIHRNIALGRKDSKHVSRADVDRAAEFALLRLTINDLPDGFDTFVEAKGSTLSGGQVQRMALARAYLRNTPVLLLDESTSALDPVSRSLIMDAIREWRHGRTTIIITHDVSLIQPEDFVLVFDNGQLVQEGYNRDIEILNGLDSCKVFSEEKIPFETKDLRHKMAGFQSESDADAFRTIPTNFSFPDDPLEIHMIAKENTRMSHISNLFSNKHTSAAFQGAYKFGAVNTHRFVGYDEGQGRSPTTTSSNNSKSPTDDGLKPKIGDSRAMTLEKFIDMTGTLAARARIGHNTYQRHRLQSETSASVPGDQNSIRLRHMYHSSRKQVQKAPKTPETVRQILGTIWPASDWVTRIIMIFGFLASGISAAATPAFSFLLSKLIQTYGKGSAGKHHALMYSMAILGLAFVSASCTYLSHMLLEYVGQRWVNHIRTKALECVLDQPRDFFTHEENSVSHITESLDRHAEEMRNLLGRFAAAIFSAFIMISVTLFWAMITQWKMTLIALSVGPYVYFMTKAFGAVSARWEAESNNTGEAASAIFTETFTRIKTIRALTLERHFTQKYTRATKDALAVGMQRALYSGLFYGLSDSSSTFTMALIFYVGARLVKDGTNTVKIMEVFIQLIITITNVSNILTFIPQINSSIDTASRLLCLSRLPRSSHEHEGDTQISSVGDINFTNLSFAYPSSPQNYVLRDVSLHLPAGTSTALVGSSGSGKSTIACLLLNLYPPINTPSPTLPASNIPPISLSGRDISHIHTSSLRSLIAIVSQTPNLFAATIAENITYGLPAHSTYTRRAAVRRAAAAAGLDTFIMSLPLGYGTRVGDGGVGLSGGQAQRLAIARALVRDPAVLILDESTSALDGESAALVRETVLELVSRRRHRGRRMLTVLIITHDEKFMACADRVVMLDRGSVVETGGYEELLARRGAFYSLVRGGVWAGEGTERKESAAVEGLAGTVDWSGQGHGYGHGYSGKGKGRML